jgi:hypothetical protein
VVYYPGSGFPICRSDRTTCISIRGLVAFPVPTNRERDDARETRSDASAVDDASSYLYAYRSFVYDTRR